MNSNMINITITNKKQRKSHRIMEKTTGILCSETATNNIAICNAGLSNGFSEEILMDHFLPFGPINNISMLPGKSCCFVSFKSIVSAVNAYNHINGLNIAQDNKPLYLAFTDKTPYIENNNGPQLPPGLRIIENFITETEENQLLAYHNFSSPSTQEMKHRLVKHYGYEFRYDINNVDKDEPLNEKIPPTCDFLWTRLKEVDGLEFSPDQLTVNYYKVGNGIPPHVDTHSAFYGPIISLSLGSSTIMDFRKQALHYSVFLPQRSLAIISGDSRYCWTHGITPRKHDIIPSANGLTVVKRDIRTSFTFRLVRRESECDCEYYSDCDSFLKNQQNKREIENDIAHKLESSHVHDVYDNIAEHFSDTRHKPWPNVLEFVQSFQLGSILVDVGCGNGKYLGRNNEILNLGCDRSVRLLDVCTNRNFEVFNCDCLQIPLRDNLADGVICIAVIHHLANVERRLASIREIIRVLRPGGQALIYVWAKDQQYKCDKTTGDNKSSYLKQDRKNRKTNADVTMTTDDKQQVLDGDLTLPVHANRKQFQHSDVLVPWKQKDSGGQTEKSTFLRYYHVFGEGELERLCKGVDNVDIVKSYYDQGNWCVIIRKVVK